MAKIRPNLKLKEKYLKNFMQSKNKLAHDATCFLNILFLIQICLFRLRHCVFKLLRALSMWFPFNLYYILFYLYFLVQYVCTCDSFLYYNMFAHATLTCIMDLFLHTRWSTRSTKWPMMQHCHLTMKFVALSGYIADNLSDLDSMARYHIKRPRIDVFLLLLNHLLSI